MKKVFVIAFKDEGRYMLSTKRFANEKAACAYAKTIAPSREPIVVEGGDDSSLLALLRRKPIGTLCDAERIAGVCILHPDSCPDDQEQS